MNLNLKITALMAATIASASCGIIVTASPAHAARSGSEYAIAVVQFDDLELSKQQDVERLKHRVKRAARDVCTPAGVAARYSLKAQRKCFEMTLRKAMTDIDQLVGGGISPVLARDSN